MSKTSALASQGSSAPAPASDTVHITCRQRRRSNREAESANPAARAKMSHARKCPGGTRDLTTIKRSAGNRPSIRG